MIELHKQKNIFADFAVSSKNLAKVFTESGKFKLFCFFIHWNFPFNSVSQPLCHKLFKDFQHFYFSNFSIVKVCQEIFLCLHWSRKKVQKHWGTALHCKLNCNLKVPSKTSFRCQQKTLSWRKNRCKIF